jgi:hypothetical protein
MKLSTINRILAVVLVVQIAAALVIFLPTVTNNQQPTGGPLLTGFNSDNVLGLIIQDNSKNELDLAKSGTDWVLSKADNYPVTASTVSSFLDKLKALQANRLIAQNPSSQNRLQVASDNFQRLVEIQQTGNKVTRLYIGSSGGANATHMRVDDQAQIYLTSGLASTDAATTASTWITIPYFSITQANIVSLKIQNKNGTFNFKMVNGAWTLDGLTSSEQFNSASVTPLLTQVSSVNLTTPFGKTTQDKFGLSAPLATVTITTSETVVPTAQPTSNTVPIVPFGPTATPTIAPVQPTQTVETTYTLQFGAKQDSGDYTLKASTSPYFVAVNATTAEAFTNLNKAGLVTAAPTPTAPSPVF